MRNRHVIANAVWQLRTLQSRYNSVEPVWRKCIVRGCFVPRNDKF